MSDVCQGIGYIVSFVAFCILMPMAMERDQLVNNGFKPFQEVITQTAHCRGSIEKTARNGAMWN